MFLCHNHFSHIQGVLSKTIKMMEDGLKPVFVFEGKPPEMKRGEVIVVTMGND